MEKHVDKGTVHVLFTFKQQARVKTPRLLHGYF